MFSNASLQERDWLLASDFTGKNDLIVEMNLSNSHKSLVRTKIEHEKKKSFAIHLNSHESFQSFKQNESFFGV